MKKNLYVLTLFVIAFPGLILGQQGGGVVSWKQNPTETTGWYWMYDNVEFKPPFTLPQISPISEVNFKNIVAGENQVPPYNDKCVAYPLQDSFWYFGQWYKPGDSIYISPDGWVSFDPSAAPGVPTPPLILEPFPTPDLPNAIIGVLWQDNNPTYTVEPRNGADYVYLFHDADSRVLIVEWYEMYSAVTPSNHYTYELQLSMGGQDKLVSQGDCGIVFSYHFIHLIFATSTNGWNADNGKAGIENQSGTAGIWYSGTISDDRVVRAGYKKVFKHDVAAYEFLEPGPMVLRWTPHNVALVLANMGYEAEQFTAKVDIYNDNDSLVYHQSLGSFSLSPGQMDTLENLPAWRPDEIGNGYDKRLIVSLANDECRGNDTLCRFSLVHCDDTLRYLWNFGDASAGINIQETRLGAFYGVDTGVLLTGGRVYLPGADPAYVKPTIEVWQSQSGCSEASTLVSSGTAGTYEAGWNKASFGSTGVWINSSKPGGIWAAVTSSSNSSATRVWEYAMRMPPSPVSCYQGTGPGRGGTWLGTAASGFQWGGHSGSFYTAPVELFAHLGFGAYPLCAKPSPPCYYDEPHDITAYEITRPGEDYAEGGVPITPEIAIANIGREKEPETGVFPVRFIAKRTYNDSIVFMDSSLVSSIGWLGNPSDDPDTLHVSMSPWTPEGKCDKDKASIGAEYELIGLVQLGEVGPDESDHCPYNDTIRRTVTVFLAHDVGVVDLTRTPDPPTPPDNYEIGASITYTATVENFGVNQEYEIPVHLVVVDKIANPDTVVWQNTQALTTLDWRGNTLGNPYTADISFPVFTVPSNNWLTTTVKTELEGDMCPDNDIGPILNISCCGVEEGKNLPKVFSLDVLDAMTQGNTVLRFAVPRSSWVKLSIYDINGRFVTNIQNDPLDPGYYTRAWDGRDNAGRKCPAGIYLVRMEAEGFKDSKKVVILR